MSRLELKQCPFCGAEAKYVHGDIFATCSRIIGCPARGKTFFIEGWNYRPIEEAKDQRIKTLESALIKIAKELD